MSQEWRKETCPTSAVWTRVQCGRGSGVKRWPSSWEMGWVLGFILTISWKRVFFFFHDFLRYKHDHLLSCYCFIVLCLYQSLVLIISFYDVMLRNGDTLSAHMVLRGWGKGNRKRGCSLWINRLLRVNFSNCSVFNLCDVPNIIKEKVRQNLELQRMLYKFNAETEDGVFIFKS